jgi:hypothetical protein
VIDNDAAELLESPCSMIVGTVAPDGLPDATRGWGLVVEDPCTVRFLLAANADQTFANLEATGVLALTVTNFATLVSYQLKGRARRVEPATAEDRIRFERFTEGCTAILHEIEHAPPELTRRIVPSGVVACVMDVAQVFDQTPGPAAGALLAPVAGGAAP